MKLQTNCSHSFSTGNDAGRKGTVETTGLRAESRFSCCYYFKASSLGRHVLLHSACSVSKIEPFCCSKFKMMLMSSLIGEKNTWGLLNFFLRKNDKKARGSAILMTSPPLPAFV
jgi:hypothetical protein